MRKNSLEMYRKHFQGHPNQLKRFGGNYNVLIKCDNVKFFIVFHQRRSVTIQSRMRITPTSPRNQAIERVDN